MTPLGRNIEDIDFFFNTVIYRSCRNLVSLLSLTNILYITRTKLQNIGLIPLLPKNIYIPKTTEAVVGRCSSK